MLAFDIYIKTHIYIYKYVILYVTLGLFNHTHTMPALNKGMDWRPKKVSVSHSRQAWD